MYGNSTGWYGRVEMSKFLKRSEIVFDFVLNRVDPSRIRINKTDEVRHSRRFSKRIFMQDTPPLKFIFL